MLAHFCALYCSPHHFLSLPCCLHRPALRHSSRSALWLARGYKGPAAALDCLRQADQQEHMGALKRKAADPDTRKDWLALQSS